MMVAFKSIVCMLSKLLNPFLAFLVAVLANFGFVAFARRTAEISLEFEPLLYSSVAVVTFISAFGAYIVLEALKKYTKRPKEYFLYVSGFVLVFSYMPIGHVAVPMESSTVAEINVLGTIHALTAVTIIGVLLKLENSDMIDNLLSKIK